MNAHKASARLFNTLVQRIKEQDADKEEKSKSEAVSPSKGPARPAVPDRILKNFSREPPKNSANRLFKRIEPSDAELENMSSSRRDAKSSKPFNLAPPFTNMQAMQANTSR